MNRLALVIVFATVVAVAMSPCQVQARLLENWPYDRLFREADVVVIAKAVSVADSGESLPDNPWKADFQGVTTTFTVGAVLKGKPDGDKLKVLHFRLKEGILIDNGPLLVSFRTKGMTLTTKTMKAGVGQPDYMLFLKKRKDGRYEAVSGQIDPKLAVREIYSPLPEGLRKAE